MEIHSAALSSLASPVAERLCEHGLPAAVASSLAQELCSLIEQAEHGQVPSLRSLLLARSPREALLSALVLAELAAPVLGARMPGLRGLLADLLLLLLSASPEEEDSSADQPAEPEPGVQQKRLLLVDDDENLRASLADILGDMGYEVETAETAEEALSYLSRVRYDAVLADVALPGIDGWELAQRIRDHDLRVVVLMLSGWRAAPSEEEERMRFVDAFVEKPVDPKTLKNLLGHLLNQ